MATRTWVTSVSHANDAGFRAWGSELSTELNAYLPKTADTGQIDWGTVTRPAVNIAAGYEMRRFNDALQATAPIFIKIEYGSGSNLLFPSLWLTVGTGSTGSGGVTGPITQRAPCTMSSSIGTSSYASLLSATPGFLGLAWKLGAQAGNGLGLLAIARHADVSGLPTTEGVAVLTGGANSTQPCSLQCVRTAASQTVFAASNQFSLVPGQVVSSAVDSDFQAYAVMGINPRVWVIPWLATVCLADIPDRATFTTALVGSTQRTLISLGSGYRPIVVGVGPGTVASYGLAMVWES